MDSTVNYLTNRTKNLTKTVKMKFLLLSAFVILTAARTKRSADNGACAAFETTKAAEREKVVEDGVFFTYPKGVCTPAYNDKCIRYETAMAAAEVTAELQPGVRIYFGECSVTLSTKEERLDTCNIFNKSKANAKQFVVEDGVFFTYPKGVCTPADNAKCVTYEIAMDAAKTLAEKTQGVKIEAGKCNEQERAEASTIFNKSKESAIKFVVYIGVSCILFAMNL